MQKYQEGFNYVPSIKDLKKIEEWEGDFHKLMKLIRFYWVMDWNCKYGTISDKNCQWRPSILGGKTRYELNTHDFWGNEVIVAAMKKNILFWDMCWYQSTADGSYEFRIEERKEPECNDFWRTADSWAKACMFRHYNK